MPSMRCMSRRGLTMMEVVISTLLVGLTLTGAMQAVSGSAERRERAGDRAVGAALADEIIAVAAFLPFSDPEGQTLDPIAAGTVEDGAAAWGAFDDIDDWSGWSASPPEGSSGTPRAAYRGWTRSVQVDFVDPASPDTVSRTPTRVKRLTVTISRQGVVRARASMLRTAAFSEGSP
ncbi:MAG: hypothetical protein AAF356_10490 [Planctomycetota bacterium]